MPRKGASVGVILPSRLEKIHSDRADSPYFVERAIASARGQTLAEGGTVSLKFILGVDADAEIPARLSERDDVIVARSETRSQVGALNAGIDAAGDHFDYIAFLEDDDRWDPQYLASNLAALETYDFASTNQIEVDEADQIVRVNDFATPSGWIMPTQTLRRVGRFNPAMRWHLDNEWLGRLGESGVRRCHLVELTAPITLANAAQVRPWIANVLRNGGRNITVVRHSYLTPLVYRLVHPRSGMARIAADPVAAVKSQAELDALTRHYGRIPW